MKVLIAGGGIGGLTAALCLAHYGHRTELFEQAPAFTAVGAGIQLSPNCTRVLHHLGLAAELQACAFLPEATQFRHWRSGRVIAENALGETLTARYGAPYYHIHRGDLLSVLLTAARAQPGIKLHTAAAVRSFTQSSDAVQLALADGQAVTGELLIGADGIHSAIREALWGPARPNFTGNVAWRAMVPTSALPANLIRPMSTAWWGPHRHFVHYYVRQGTWVNCVCVTEKRGWEIESWTEPGATDELRADFRGWHTDIQQLIDAADPASLYKWALFDRQPMAAWGRGRVSLLGDACHPTLPFMAQGAAMAIEDAAVLAHCLQQRRSVADNLHTYEQLRRPRTASIQSGSRRNAKIFHLRGVQAWLRNRAARRAGARSMARLYSYNALDPT